MELTSISNISSYLFHLFEAVLRQANVEHRVVIYTVLVVLLSIPRELFSDTLTAIQPSLTDQHTFVNHYLVKNAFYISYGFMIIYHIVLCFVFKSYMVEKRNEATAILPLTNTSSHWTFKIPNAIKRMVLLIGIYFLQLEVYGIVIEYMGSCSSVEYKRAKACVNAHYKWRGVSFSGHIFRQLLSNLIILEECGVLRKFSICSYCDVKESKDPIHGSSNESSTDCSSIKMRFVQILTLILSCWVILLDVELVTTLLWFHEFDQKVLSLVWALVVWGFSYNFVFPLLSLLDT